MRDAQQTLDLMTQYGYEPVVLRGGRIRTAPVDVPAATSAAPGDESFELRNACFRRAISRRHDDSPPDLVAPSA
jgi:hypothetical protein